MQEGHQVAYLELWRNKTHATTAIVTVRLDGSRRLAEHPKLRSDQVLDRLKKDGFVFQRLLPPTAVQQRKANQSAKPKQNPKPAQSSDAVYA